VKRTIKVEGIEFSDSLNILNVDSLQRLTELQARGEFLLETPEGVYLLKPGVAFRYLKPEAKPKILKAMEIIVNPDAASFKVTLNPQELLSFALKERIPVFETETEYIIPSDVMLIAKKGSGKT